MNPAARARPPSLAHSYNALKRWAAGAALRPSSGYALAPGGPSWPGITLIDAAV